MLQQELSIRRARDDDLPVIVSLWKEMADFHVERDRYFTMTPSAEESVAAFLRQWMSDDDSEIWVAEQRGRVIGYCLASIAERPPVFLERRHGRIIDLAVTAEYRRRGIGRALVERAREWFRDRGVDSIELKVATSNEVATAFWRSLGFVPNLETFYQRL